MTNTISTIKNNGRPRRYSMDKLSEAEKIQVIWRMKKVYYLSMFSMSFMMQPRMQVYLASLNAVEYARMMANSVMGMFGIQIMLNPVLSKLTDVWGRKYLLQLGSTASFLLRTFDFLSPNINSFFYSTMLGSISMMYSTGVTLSITDLFKNDPTRVAIEVGKLSMGFILSSIFCPIPSAWLTSKNVRYGIGVSWVLALLQLYFTQDLEETLPDEKRIPVSGVTFNKVNPLSFINLFLNGYKLAALSIMEGLTYMVKTSASSRMASLSQQQLFAKKFDWNYTKQTTLDTWGFFCKIFGFVYNRKIIQSFGLKKSLYYGYLLDMIKCVSDWYSATPFQYGVNSILFGAQAVANTSVNALLRKEGKRLGIDRNSLQQYLSTLGFVSMFLCQRLWSNVYTRAASSGDIRIFFIALSVIPFVNMVLAKMILNEEDYEDSKKEKAK